MASKIMAAIIFLIPVVPAFTMAIMALSYKGPLVLLYIAAALLVAALCAWPIVNIFRGTLNPWSVWTWGFAAIDLCLGVLTLLPKR